ncbi:endolytic transglycosylase MltG [Patescibacteria group bacterium]|nr:endolytic transglycosylase MltG [Patescibacteria group bacterium]
MSEGLDPEKYHILTPKKKRIILSLTLFVFLIIVPVLSYFYYKAAVFRPSQTAKEANFEIKSGDGVFDVAGMLYDKEAINSEFLFILYVFLNRADTNIQAGNYTIPAGTNIVQLVHELSRGRNDISLTFLEGWRIEQYAILASQRLARIDYQKFLELAKPYEGYLFPDTYFFNRDAKDEELIERMTDNFNNKTKEILSDDNLKKVGLTKEQVVIFASMVEREVHTSEDRPLVAGILIKRWKEGMKLDVDATTQYSIALKRLCKGDAYCVPTLEDIYKFQWWQNNLTRAELDTEDPYNTRAVVGLPPAPISSVSLSSLSAVIYYEESPYYYYLTDKTGVTHYAETITGHNSNVQKYLRN